jgi:hypothetical protein
MRKAVLLPVITFVLFLGLLPVFAQKPSAPPKIDNAFVQQQFGNQFTYLPEYGVSVGDLDGDGVEDIVIAAHSKNPMLDQGEHKYSVIDPFNDFYGYGDPRVTTSFSDGDPTHRGLVILIICGVGPDAWRARDAKAKFVIVNLPYRSINVRKFHTRKRGVEAIYVEEASETGDCSAIFFDGRKFRYVPMGNDLE